MEQPERESIEDDMSAATTWFKCQQCGFTCTRLNVIVWHNKAHLSKVCNYDSGIKIPGRRRRRQGASRGGRDGRKRGKDRKGKENLDHSHTNGDVSGVGGGKKDLQDTQQILMDWDDEDDTGEPGTPRSNDNKDGDSNGYSDADDDYPPPQPRYERRPMPKPADLNSAFDALLAATNTQSNLNTSTSSGHANNYINNDSDSDYSDWEKYYARDSGSGSEDEEEVEQESDIKSLCEANTGEGEGGGETTEQQGKAQEEATESTEATEVVNEKTDGIEVTEVVKMKDKTDRIEAAEALKVKDIDGIEVTEVVKVKTDRTKATEVFKAQENTDSIDDMAKAKEETDRIEATKTVNVNKTDRSEAPEILKVKEKADRSDAMEVEKVKEETEATKVKEEELKRNETHEVVKVKGETERVEAAEQVKAKEEGTKSMSHSHIQKPQEMHEELKWEDAEATNSPQRIVSEGQVSPAREPTHPCPDQAELTPEPEPEQEPKPELEQEEFMQTDAGQTHDSKEPPQDLEETKQESLETEKAEEEVTERMEVEEEVSSPSEYYKEEEEEMTRESAPPEEDEIMKPEEMEYYEEPDMKSFDMPVDMTHPDKARQLEGPEVSRDHREPCQEYSQGHDSPPGRDVKDELEPPTHTQTSRDSEGEQQGVNRLSRYIDEFSDTMVAKEEEVATGTSVEFAHRGHRQLETSSSSSSSPRPVHTGHDGPAVSASPVRTGDLSITSSSGTTYMLVAVDAHGNTVPTVPTPSLSEGGNDLVAVEATMEDGTTRTLYIDPAQLGPNVDLSNLMLHIDTTGQEHVIIPSSSSSDSEGPPAPPRPAPTVHYSPPSHSFTHGEYESPASPTEPSHTHPQRHGDSDS